MIAQGEFSVAQLPEDVQPAGDGSRQLTEAEALTKEAETIYGLPGWNKQTTSRTRGRGFNRRCNEEYVTDEDKDIEMEETEFPHNGGSRTRDEMKRLYKFEQQKLIAKYLSMFAAPLTK